MSENAERLTKPYKEHLREILKTDEDYVGYLSACHNEGAATFALAVRDVLSFVRSPVTSAILKFEESARPATTQCERRDFVATVPSPHLCSLILIQLKQTRCAKPWKFCATTRA